MVQKSTILLSNPREVSIVKSCSIPQLNTLGVDRHMELYIASYNPYGEKNTSVTFLKNEDKFSCKLVLGQ